MMRVLVFCVVAVGASPAAMARDFADCTGAQTQVAATECAAAGWKVSDTELNRLWKIVKPAADAQGRGQQLLTAQRAWLRYRDATCESERDQYKGGSIAGQIYWSCMDRVTRVRNRELQMMIK